MSNTELSLIDFIKLLWSYKRTFIVITLFVFLISMIYSFIATPVYEAEVSVLPPKISTVNALNVGHAYSNKLSLKEYSLEQVYQFFIIKLNSEALKYEFYKHYNSLSKDKRNKDNSFSEFSKKIRIQKSPQLKEIKYTVSVRADSYKGSKELLGSFLAFVEERAKLAAEEEWKSEKKAVLLTIKQKLQGSQFMQGKSKDQKLIELENALMSAKAAGIETLVPNVQISNHYLLGAKLIRLEMENLKRQKNKPFSTTEMLELENLSNFYSELQIPIKKVSLYQLDGMITASSIFPKYSFIGTLGLLGGVLLACFIILFHSVFVHKQVRPI